MAAQVPDLAGFQARVNCDERSLAFLGELPPGDQLVAMDIVESRGLENVKNPSAITASAVRRLQKEPGRARLEYIQRHLDERCVEALSQLPPMVQESICQKLDLTNVRNLSAFVFSQIRAAKSNGGQARPVMHHPGLVAGPPVMRHPGPPVVPPMVAYSPMTLGTFGRDRSRSPMGAVSAPQVAGNSATLEAFRMRVPIDDKAVQALMGLTHEDQFIACALVEKGNARNPSAVTWSMVKLVQNKPVQAKLEYLKHVVDENASRALDSLPPAQLANVLLNVELRSVRNVSAFIWSRIKDFANVEPVQFPQAQAAPPMIFRPQPLQARVGAQPRPSVKVERPVIQSESTLESVASMGLVLDNRCQAGLAQLSHEEQMQILSEVDANVRNPSAFVWSKIRAMGKS